MIMIAMKSGLNCNQVSPCSGEALQEFPYPCAIYLPVGGLLPWEIVRNSKSSWWIRCWMSLSSNHTRTHDQQSRFTSKSGKEYARSGDSQRAASRDTVCCCL